MTNFKEFFEKVKITEGAYELSVIGEVKDYRKVLEMNKDNIGNSAKTEQGVSTKSIVLDVTKTELVIGMKSGKNVMLGIIDASKKTQHAVLLSKATLDNIKKYL